MSDFSITLNLIKNLNEKNRLLQEEIKKCNIELKKLSNNVSSSIDAGECYNKLAQCEDYSQKCYKSYNDVYNKLIEKDNITRDIIQKNKDIDQTYKNKLDRAIKIIEEYRSKYEDCALAKVNVPKKSLTGGDNYKKKWKEIYKYNKNKYYNKKN